MNLDAYTSRLRADLVTAAELGDDQTKKVASALAGAAENSARLMLLAALSDLAAEITEQADGVTVHVRLDGTDALVDITSTTEAPTAPEGEPYSFEDATGDISRVTLRLVEQMKERAEEAAQQNGMSLNSWMSRAVQGALRDQMTNNLRNAQWPRPGDA